MTRCTTFRCRGVVVLEPLEARALFSETVSFFGVGIRHDAGPAAFFVEGTIEPDDSVLGEMRSATAQGPATTVPLDWTAYNRGPRGSFTFTTRDGFLPYPAQSGTQFLSSEGWSLGSFVGRDGDGMARDLAVLAEAFTAEELRSAFGGDAQLQMARLTGSGVEYFSLRIIPDFSTSVLSEFTFEYHLPEGTFTATKRIASQAGGVITLETGEVMVLTGFRQSVLMADLDAADGIVGVAAGRVRLAEARPPNGVYHAALVTTGPESAGFFGIRPGDIGPDGAATVNLVLRMTLVSLNPSSPGVNTYEVHRQDEWDAGIRVPAASGTWRVVSDGVPFPGIAASEIEMRDPEGRLAVLRASGGRSVFFEEVRSAADVREGVFGLAVDRNLRSGAVTEILAATEPGGRPVAYFEIRPVGNLLDAALFSVDLIDEVGGEPVVGDVFVWSAPASGNATFIAGLSEGGEVQVWRFGEFGWTYTNLTVSLPGARPIAGALYATRFDTSPNSIIPSQSLVGFDSEGAFVAYEQITGELLEADQVWRHSDTADDGFDGALPDGTGVVPAGGFPGGLAGWSAGWGARHFAGLDEDGGLWVIWRAPHMARWRIDNLGAEAGTPALVGVVTALRTDWDGFQIAGTSQSGDIVVTWWAPGQPAWESRDLTAELAGPALEPGSITSNFSRGITTMNIVGIAGDDRVAVYWWTPELGWNIGSLSGTTPPADVPTGPHRMVSSTWAIDVAFVFHSQSLLGTGDDGGLARLVWRSFEPDEWRVQDIAGESTPYFT